MADKSAADENSKLLELIFQIHESPCKIVLAITGGGAELIGELLRHGSGSATVLEAIVPYSTDAMDRLLGRKPEKYCSEKTARLMAMVAYLQALELSKASETGGPEVPEIIGIGATCKLKAENEREGRKHEIHVSIQAACKTGVATLELTSERTREEEEKIASALIFNVLARHCGVSEIDLPGGVGAGEEKEEKVIEKYSSVSGPVGEILRQQSQGPEGHEKGMARINFNEEKAPEEIKLIFPGSFDPCHKNHAFIAELASKKYNAPVHFEISLTNVDKPPIDFISLERRLDSLRKYKDEVFMGDIYLTNAPLFLQKAALFPDSTFIVGADTINRIFDAKYYDGVTDIAALLSYFKEKNVRFLVFGRKAVEISISPEILEFCEIIPLDEYEDDGTSSTEIRKKDKNEY